MTKNGKMDRCSANHRNCKMRYFLNKFSGYIIYEMPFDILYCFIKPFIYEYLIFTFICGDFLRYSQNMGKNGENTPFGGHVRCKLLEISVWNLVIIGIKIRASKIKGSGFVVSLWRKGNWWLLSSYWGHSEKKLQNGTFSLMPKLVQLEEFIKM